MIAEPGLPPNKSDELNFKLLAEISARFVNVSASEVDLQIEDALRRICEFHQIDHSSVWQVAPEDPEVIVLTHLYRDPSLRPRPPRMVGRESFPWVQAKLIRKEVVCVPDVEDVPPEAAKDHETWRNYSVKSALSFPLFVCEGPICGVLSFEATRKARGWSAPLWEQLQYLAQLFSSALDRKHSEQILREGEARLSLAAASANAGLWTLEPVSGRIWATDKAKELFSFLPKDQMTLDVVLARVHSEDRDTIRKAIEQGMLTGEEVSVEYRVQLRDGSQRWMSSRGRRQSGNLGEPDRLMGVSIDITEITQLRERLQAESDYLKSEIEVYGHFAEIVEHSKALKKAFQQIERVARTESTVLITGETGTGKELAARAIHNLSSRKDRVMVKVDCSALPPTLIESELFGREKGAYTGALTSEVGRFEFASGSTLFPDEIGELPLELQAKLLRVLQDGEFEHLGSPRQVKVDVRVIAATNRDLAECVNDGSFRQDLYYRLKVFPIELPSLRDRPEDIPLLTWAFVRQLEKKMGKKIETIPKKSMEALLAYEWPGNVRELKNVVEQALIISTGSQLEVQMPGRRDVTMLPTLKGAEHRHILAVLQRTGWRVKGPGGAAELLGMKPSTLYTTMQRLGIPTKHGKDGIPS